VHLLRVDANLALDRVEVVLKTIATEVLEIGFEDGGPEDGRSVFFGAWVAGCSLWVE
jgi:hypothetical protein